MLPKLLCVVGCEELGCRVEVQTHCRWRSADHVLFRGSPPSCSSSAAHLRYLLKWLIICVTSGDRQLGPRCFYEIIYLSQIWNYFLYTLGKAVMLAEESYLVLLCMSVFCLLEESFAYLQFSAKIKKTIFLITYVFLYVCLIEAVEDGNGSVTFLGDSMFCFLECSTLLPFPSSEENGCGGQDGRQWANSLAALLSATANALPQDESVGENCYITAARLPSSPRRLPASLCRSLGALDQKRCS